jgi:hypothetical protein
VLRTATAQNLASYSAAPRHRWQRSCLSLIVAARSALDPAASVTFANSPSGRNARPFDEIGPLWKSHDLAFPLAFPVELTYA